MIVLDPHLTFITKGTSTSIPSVIITVKTMLNIVFVSELNLTVLQSLVTAAEKHPVY